MVFFRKKKQVDLDELFKAKYKEINDELLELIDQGVDYDRQHFEMLKQDLKKQIDLLKGLNYED